MPDDQQPDRPRLCFNGCGHHGNPDTHGYCSVCHKTFTKARPRDPNIWTTGRNLMVQTPATPAPPPAPVPEKITLHIGSQNIWSVGRNLMTQSPEEVVALEALVEPSVCPSSRAISRVPDLYRGLTSYRSRIALSTLGFFVPGFLGSQHARLRSHLLPSMHCDINGDETRVSNVPCRTACS